MKLAIALVLAVLLVACANAMTTTQPEETAGRTLGPGEHWVPVRLDRNIGGNPLVCAGVGFTGNSHILAGSADDPRLVWMMVGGERRELEWPVGYSARFTPDLELLNENGSVVAHEGSRLSGGCEMSLGIWWVDL
jgi:hypothetical protein